MNGILLNWIVDLWNLYFSSLTNLIAYISKLREENMLLNILLYPVWFGFTLFRIITNGMVRGPYQRLSEAIPFLVLTLHAHIMTATPYSVYCFNKTAFAVFFAETAALSYWFLIPRDKPFFILPYAIIKMLVVIVPFVALSPVQRLPFWLLAILLTAAEFFVGCVCINSWGYGPDFENGQFYKKWGKHYSYRHITSNRRIAIHVYRYIYGVLKLLVLNDFLCYKFEKTAARYVAPWSPTWGSFASSGSTVADTFNQLHSFGNKNNMNSMNPLCSSNYMHSLTPPAVVSEFYTLHLAPYSFLLICVFLCLAITFLFFTPLELVGWLHAVFSRLSLTRLFQRFVELFALPFRKKSSMISKKLNYAASCAVLQSFVILGFGMQLASVGAYRLNLTFSFTPTQAGTATDYDFVNALIEQDTVANLRYGVLFLLALSSLGVYSIILAGWSSNSKYAFIGALRSAAQMISYEVAISLIILPVIIFCGSLNLTMITYVQHITDWLLWPLLPIALLFLVAMLAETNRTPFDLPEAEAELVAGYNVDYSSLPFAMFFLGEYCNMILISTMFCLLFLSGGLNSVGLSAAFVLSSKAAVTWIFFVLVRATLPRYRYDQLMDIGWKVFLPVAGSFLLFVFGVLVFFNSLPVTNELPLNLPTVFETVIVPASPLSRELEIKNLAQALCASPVASVGFGQ